MKLQKIKKFWATALLPVFHSLPLPSFVHNVMDFLLWPLLQKLKTFFAFLLLPFFCFSRCCSSFWPSLDIKEAVPFFSKSAILYPENLLFQNFMLFLIDFFFLSSTFSDHPNNRHIIFLYYCGISASLQWFEQCVVEPYLKSDAL